MFLEISLNSLRTFKKSGHDCCLVEEGKTAKGSDVSEWQYV